MEDKCIVCGRNYVNIKLCYFGARKVIGVWPDLKPNPDYIGYKLCESDRAIIYKYREINSNISELIEKAKKYRESNPLPSVEDFKR